jgi:hypothetical protein
MHIHKETNVWTQLQNIPVVHRVSCFKHVVNLPYIYLFSYLFIHLFGSAQGLTTPLIQWVAKTPSSEVKRRSLKLTTDLHLVSRLTTEEALPSLPVV